MEEEEEEEEGVGRGRKEGEEEEGKERKRGRRGRKEGEEEGKGREKEEEEEGEGGERKGREALDSTVPPCLCVANGLTLWPNHRINLSPIPITLQCQLYALLACCYALNCV